MEILHFEDLGDTSVISECSLGVNLVIFFYVASRFFTLGNRTFTYGDIARLAANAVVLVRVSNFNSPQKWLLFRNISTDSIQLKSVILTLNNDFYAM